MSSENVQPEANETIEIDPDLPPILQFNETLTVDEIVDMIERGENDEIIGMGGPAYQFGANDNNNDNGAETIDVHNQQSIRNLNIDDNVNGMGADILNQRVYAIEEDENEIDKVDNQLQVTFKFILKYNFNTKTMYC